VHRKALVLIVETDDLIRQLLTQWLDEAGYAVRAGHEPAAGGRKPDVVIVDIAQPRQADARMRALHSEHGAPVIVMSGRFRRGLARSSEPARRLGARTLLPKPFTREELLCAVAEAMAARPRRGA
jgi:DNA-binding response OmpR family regulator